MTCISSKLPQEKQRPNKQTKEVSLHEGIKQVHVKESAFTQKLRYRLGDEKDYGKYQHQIIKALD